jgi:hypothetical protein
MNHRYRNLTILLLAAATLARIAYLLRGPLQLFPDEAYYWQWSRHLALSAGALLFGLGIAAAGLCPEALGWRALGERVGEIRAAAPGRYPFLLAPDYGLASELAFYVPGHPPAYDLDRSAKHQYNYWPGPETRVGQDALFVNQGEDPSLADRLRRAFAEVEAPELLPVSRRGEVIKTFFIYRCHGYRGRRAAGIIPGEPRREQRRKADRGEGNSRPPEMSNRR